MIFKHIFNFVRVFMDSAIWIIVLTASIMFIWLSLLPPVEISGDANAIVNEAQYVFAVFKESAKYAALLVFVSLVADMYVSKSDGQKSTVFEGKKRKR